MESYILFVLCLCAVVTAKSIGKVTDARDSSDLPDLSEIREETKDLLPKYSGAYDNEFEIKVVPMEFNITHPCYIFCKRKQTTTPIPIIYEDGESWWQKQIKKSVERDRNLDHFPVLKQTFGHEGFRSKKKDETSTLVNVGKQIAYIFRPLTSLVMKWF